MTLDHENKAEARLLAALRDRGAVVERPPGRDEGWDVAARFGKQRVLFELKALSTLRLDDLRGRLAWAVLQARRYGRVDVRAHVAVVVDVPTITNQSIAAAREFMRSYAPKLGWGLVARDGTAFFQVSGVVVDNDLPTRRRTTVDTWRTQALFSDLTCWMLKVLVLRDVDEHLWGGPRVRVSGYRELARAAEVSVAQANRAVNALIARDFVRATGRELVVVRRRALFDAWSGYLRQAPLRRRFVRWAMGNPRDVAEIFATRPARNVAETKYAIGGFAACKAFGILHATPTLAEVHIQSADDAMARFDLELCDQRDAHCVLVETKGRSAYDGAVTLHGVRYVDVLQAALDCSGHAARGLEQAEYILEEVLQWRDE